MYLGHAALHQRRGERRGEAFARRFLERAFGFFFGGRERKLSQKFLFPPRARHRHRHAFPDPGKPPVPRPAVEISEVHWCAVNQTR